MLTDDELWAKCQKDEPITEEDLGINANLWQSNIKMNCNDYELGDT